MLSDLSEEMEKTPQKLADLEQSAKITQKGIDANEPFPAALLAA